VHLIRAHNFFASNVTTWLLAYRGKRNKENVIGQNKVTCDDKHKAITLKKNRTYISLSEFHIGNFPDLRALYIKPQRESHSKMCISSCL